MSTIPREKIALVVFVACILLIIAGIVAYLFAGHSWNYAASRIDDATGEMDGYRVVMYEGTAVPKSSRINAKGELKKTPVSLAAAKRSYGEKGADVFTVDTKNLSLYRTPLIIERDGYRIGIMSVETADTRRDMQNHADYLAKRQCDMVMAIAPNASTVSGITGIDVVLDLEQTGPLSASSVNAHRYRVKMSDVGTVGAIVISPSEVVSARTVTR